MMIAMNNKSQTGYTVLVIMVLVSVILVLVSFSILRRRTNLPQPSNQAPAVETKPADRWVDFENKIYGVKFQYPENVFTPNISINSAGMVTRVFLGSGASGTITAEVFNRQFDPKNIINESSKPAANATALSLAGQIGYQYQDSASGCDRKVVQVPLSNQTLALVFANCPSDAEPKLLADQDLIRQVLNSVKLSPPTSDSGVKQFNITVDDRGANPDMIEVTAGDLIQITITVGVSDVRNGSLEFRSVAANSGAISPGTSKTITFTADQSFELIPYWPNAGINKNYKIRVNVTP